MVPSSIYCLPYHHNPTKGRVHLSPFTETEEILGNDISFDGFSISSTPTQATGQDIRFDNTGAIRSLLGVAVEGADLGFIGNQISSHFGLSTGVVSDDISFDAASGQIRSVQVVFT